MKLLEHRFPHRVNADGTFDSICPKCFLTIGKSLDEFTLQKIEEEHECDAEALSLHAFDIRQIYE